MNPISFITHHLISRKASPPRDPIKKLADRFEFDAQYLHFSKREGKRLEKLFNDARSHVCQHADFELRRSELLRKLNNVQENVCPGMLPCTARLRVQALSGAMLEEVRNLQAQPSLQDAEKMISREPTKNDAPSGGMSEPRFRSPDICPPDDSVRVIDVKTMSLREAFALKLSNASVSAMTKDKLDAIFTRDYQIRLTHLQNNGNPELYPNMFGDASVPGFKSLPEAATELDEIASMVSRMKESDAASSLEVKVRSYKAHVEAATRWWTEAATHAARPTDSEAAWNEHLRRRAADAPTWLGVTPLTLALEIGAQDAATLVQTPMPQTRTPSFNATAQVNRQNRVEMRADELMELNAMFFFAKNPQYR